MTHLRKTFAVDVVYHKLKHDLTHFVFKPGERLIETSLSSEYGVSRTPVREALRLLEQEGLVTVLTNGNRVAPEFDPTQYEDLFAMRVVLEELAVQEACQRGTDQAINALRISWGEEFDGKAVPLDGSYVTANERFHLGVANLTGNRFLIETLVRISDRTRIITMVDFTEPERIAATRTEHEAILSAIEERSPDKARELVRDHILRSQENIGELVKDALGRIYLRGSRMSP